MIERMDTLALMLTGECNLHCRYCYARNRRRERMNEDTLRTAIDLALYAINERVTILSKIEVNQMRPDEKIIAKLQKELGIVLKEKVPEVVEVVCV